MHVLIIAEAGVNHNGEEDMALSLVDAAAETGADVVKFQTFKSEEVISATAPKAVYQMKTTDPGESQLDMVKKLELSQAFHHELADHCADKGIRFLSTPFDLGSLNFLVGEMKLETLKISSGEITSGPLLLLAGTSGCDIILSTGMSTLDEIECALGVLAFGMTGGGTPSRSFFRDAFNSDAGKAALRDKVALLHCTSEYPAPAKDANLKAMETLSNAFGLRVGLSDHSVGTVVPIAAAALGAEIIEKHFTMDRTLPGPDHRASLEPDELKEMVAGIRAVEEALGDGIKKPYPSEKKNIPIARKSLVALKAIKSGEPFTEETLGTKRPGTGVSPMEYWNYLAKTAERGYIEGELIDP